MVTLEPKRRYVVPNLEQAITHDVRVERSAVIFPSDVYENVMANATNLSYLMSTGNLTQVLYGRNPSKGQSRDVYLLCTYFVASNTRTFKFKQPVSKKTEKKTWGMADAQNSDGRKSSTKTVTYKSENKQHSKSTVCNKTDKKNWEKNSNSSKGTNFVNKKPDNKHKQYYDDDPKNVNSIFREIGLVYKNDKMYSMEAKKIHSHMRDFSCFGPNKSYFSSKSFQNHNKKANEDSMDNSGYTYNTQGRHRKFNPNSSSSEMVCYRNVDDNQNNYQQQSITRKVPGHSDTRKTKKRHYYPQNTSTKYWSMRFMLFSKFNDGILLDDESFYSVCPEPLSEHIANRCKNSVALDPFCGAGGNVIQLAKKCKKVIAVDIDPNKIALARHNAEIYGVADKIKFVVGDFFALAPHLKADVVVMSPPWGGPEYSNKESYSIESMCDDYYGGGFGIFHLVKNIAPRIAFHMPKNTNIYECLWLAKDFGFVEIQQNIINQRLNSITAFFGDFIDMKTSDYQKYR